MPRIRTIKPEFWQDEKLAPLAPIDRLVFLGLISNADDAGRLVDSPRLLNGLIFPDTDDDCQESINTLCVLKRVQRYTSNSGQKLLQIVHWEIHQKVANPSKHCLPGPPEGDDPQTVNPPSLDSHEDLTQLSLDPQSPILDHGPRTMEEGPRIKDLGSTTPFEREFLEFWERYPLKVGKKAALKQYQARRKAGAAAGEILEGLARYLAFKAAARERHHNPATFLGPNEWFREPWTITEEIEARQAGPRDEEPDVDPRFKREFKPDIRPRSSHADREETGEEQAENIPEKIPPDGFTRAGDLLGDFLQTSPIQAKGGAE